MRDNLTNLADSINTTFFTMLERIVTYIPQIVTAMFILLVGICVGVLAYYGVLHALRIIKIDTMVAKTPLESTKRVIGIKKSFSEILSIIVFWFVLFATGIFIADVLQLEQLSALLALLLLYIPNILLGLILLVVGLLLARFVDTLIVATIDKKHNHFGVLLGKTAYILTLLFIIPVVLNQIGVDISFITTNMSIVVAIILAAIAVALVLNTRTIVTNWIACQQLRNVLTLGNTVVLAKHKGVIRGFTNTGVIMHHEGMNTVVPAHEFFVQSYTVKAEEK